MLSIWRWRRGLLEALRRRLTFVSSIAWSTTLGGIVQLDWSCEDILSLEVSDCLLRLLLDSKSEEAEALRVLCHGVHDDLRLIH